MDTAKISENAAKAVNVSKVIFGAMEHSIPGYSNDFNIHTAEISWLLSVANRNKTKYEGDIWTQVYFPLYDSFFENRTSGRCGIYASVTVFTTIRLFLTLILTVSLL